MKRRWILVVGLMCMVAQIARSEGTKVMRFVPVAGEESEVALNTLQKVVFTPDSIVLIAAKDGAQTPMYKYGYQSIIFTESSAPTGLSVMGYGLPDNGEKFIKDGQIYIRYDGEVFNLMGLRVY